MRLAAYLAVTGTVTLLLLEGALRLLAPMLGDLTLDPEERYARWGEAASLMLERRPNSLAIFDAELGWRPQPGIDNGTDRISRQGVRDAPELAATPPPGVTRIAAVGDSFTYGTGVGPGESWPAWLARRAKDVEVLNFGMPGYGPGQILLRFEHEALGFSPEIVVFGLTTPAMDRILIRSAIFQNASPHFLTKPQFVLEEDGSLRLRRNPLRSLEDVRRYADDPRGLVGLGDTDYWYDPLVFENPFYARSHAVRALVNVWGTLDRRFLDGDRPLAGAPGRGEFNRGSRAFRILGALLARFTEGARAAGARPVVVLLPDKESVERSRAGHRGVMDPVREVLCPEHGLVCHDSTEAFLEAPAPLDPSGWFSDGFHYSSEGNRRVADWLVEALGLPAAERPRDTVTAAGGRGSGA